MAQPVPTSFLLGPYAAYHRDALTILVPEGNEGFDALRDYLGRRSAEVGRKLILMVLVRPGVSVDPVALRSKVHALLDDAAASLSCLVIAIDGHGFFASTFMSISSMLFMHTRTAKTPVRVFKNLDGAGEFVEQTLDGADWVVPFIESVKRALG